MLPPETFPSVPRAPSLESETIVQHPQANTQLNEVAARLGRLVADPRLKFKIQGDPELKSQVRSAIAEVQAL
jgi:hypothetical protein